MVGTGGHGDHLGWEEPWVERGARCYAEEVSNQRGAHSRAGQRGGREPCVSETREGAIVGKEAVVSSDKGHRKARQDRIFTIGYSSLVLKNKIRPSK